MGKDTVVELRRPEQGRDLLTAMLQERAQWLVAEAVQVEFEQFLARFAGQRTEDGHAGVVRNGFQPVREVLTGIGPVGVRIPKVRSGPRRRRYSAPRWCRRTCAGQGRWMRRCRGCTCMAFPPATCARRSGAGGHRGRGVVGIGGGTAEGPVEHGVPGLAPREAGQGPLGLLVGRRHLFVFGPKTSAFAPWS